jgi:Set1/Ash2 histone methyltransferase complex subunit ASH2
MLRRLSGPAAAPEAAASAPRRSELFSLKWEEGVALCRKRIWKDLRVQPDGVTVKGHRGYGLARCNRGFVEGCWYYEAVVQHAPGEGNCRIGWVQAKDETQLQAYPGFDEWGYGYRDKDGTYFHQARASGQGPSYGQGDVVGCLLHVPAGPLAAEKARLVAQQGLQEEYDDWVTKQPGVTQLDITGLHSAVPGSAVVFYKNGVEAGVAFRDVRHGVWYPAVGLYGGGTVTLNFGPNFRFPPTPPPGLPTPWPIRRLDRVLMLLLVFDDRHPRPSKRRRTSAGVRHFIR